MKKIPILLILTTMVTFTAAAQDNVIKFNPLSLVFGNAEINYERVVGSRQSLQLEAGYTYLNFDGDRYTGFTVGAQYRFYLQKKYTAPEGWFAAPYINYCSARYEDEDFNINIFSLGAVLGYQWQLDPVAIDLYFGPGYFQREADATDFDLGFDGLGLKVGLAVGLGF